MRSKLTNPETNVIPSTPLTALWFNGLQIMIREHQLGIGEARLALDSDLVEEVPCPGALDFLHDEV
jgi:hypothetical protein